MRFYKWIALAVLFVLGVAACTSSPHSSSSSSSSTTHRHPSAVPAHGVRHPHAVACNGVALGSSCGGYSDAANFPPSNGYNTYVANQNVGTFSGGTESLTATGPNSWSVTANLVNGGGAVQTYPDTQQLTNNWNPAANNFTGSSNTPLASLSTFTITYNETAPNDAGSSYEFSPDIWQSNYPQDVMFWVDVRGRCNTGSFGSTVLGTAVFGGQTWTVNRYGGQGAEIIFVLDSNPAVPNSCSNQTSGTIDIKAGLNWLVTNGAVTGPVVLTQANTGYELTAADNTTFRVNSMSYIMATTGGATTTPPTTTPPTTTPPTTTPPTTPAPGVYWACVENSFPEQMFDVSSVQVTCPAGSTRVSFPATKG